MGLARSMPSKLQFLAALGLVLAMVYLENQIQRLEESKGKLGAQSRKRFGGVRNQRCKCDISQAASRHPKGSFGGSQHLCEPSTPASAVLEYRRAPERAVALHQVRAIEQRHTQELATRAEGGPWGTGGPDDLIVLYNRVPKTGSTSFTNIAYDLCARNKYHVLHINTSRNNPVMSLQDQARFVKNITVWKEMKPGFYHGHLAFVDFSKFGAYRKPIYVNVVRDPIERLVSYYYFLRFGDNYRPSLRRRKQGDKKTFDECVQEKGVDCAPEKLWLQIPFFCGHSAECWTVGSRWALEQAKLNLVNEYLLVGVTEELEDFILILEAVLPRFFKGATELFKKGTKSHLRKTAEKKAPSADAVHTLQQSEVWKLEHEFYEFALEQFSFIRAHTVREKDGELYPLAQNYFYEKIYPKQS